MRTLPPATEKRIKAWISFVAGLAFLGKFALFTPALLNPALTVLIAACIFGPGVIQIFSGNRNDDDE